MTIYSTITCDRAGCGRELHVPHAAAPLPEAHRAGWVTLTARGHDTHYCPDCGRTL